MGPRPKLNFWGIGRVAYRIKAKDAYRDMVANILPTDTPLISGKSQKVK